MIKNYLPKQIREVIDETNLEEIRLRISKPVVLETATGRTILDYISTKRDIETALDRMCEASVYAFIDEIRQGFITLNGGHRVGITGRAVIKDDRITNITYISSLNIRIAKEIKEVSKDVIDKIKDKNTLIISPPNAGKTTLLRDICRKLGNENKVGLVDERGEIGSLVFGRPQFDIGINTDVYDLCPKPTAINMLVRAMSPEYVIVDEIGTEADSKAILDACSLGVKVIATAHGNCYDDIIKRMPELASVFEKIVILSRKNGEFFREVIDV